METFKKLLSFIKALPIWGRVLTILIVVFAAVILFFTSCSTTKAVITNPTGKTNPTITITVTNPQTVEVKPSVDSNTFNLSLMP